MQISVITPALQCGSFIAEAIESVRDQVCGGCSIEHIIVDGGSTDETLEILSRYDHLTVISEPDLNAADALNKGVRKATGEFLMLLMADDRLGQGAIANIKAASEKHPEIDMWSIDTLMFDVDGGGQQCSIRILASPEDTALTIDNILYNPPLLHSRLIRHKVFDRLGGFDLNYPLSSDREFMTRCVLAQVSECYLGGGAYELRVHPGSTTMSRNTENIIGFLGEHLTWAQALGEGSSVSDLNQTTLRKWQVNEEIRLLYYLLRGQKWGEAMRLFSNTFLRNPKYILLFLTLLYIGLRPRK